MTEKHKNPTKGFFITVDETEDTRNKIGDYYLAVATLVNDRKGFRSAVEDLGYEREIGYSDDKYLVPYVLVQSRPFVDKVYVAGISKSDPKYMRKSSKNIHYEVMRGLRSMLPYDKDDDVFVLVDQKSAVSSETVQRIFADIEGKDMVVRNSHYCAVEPSNWFPELQVQDFYTGTIGGYLNSGEKRYIDHLRGNWVQETFNKKRRGHGKSQPGAKSAEPHRSGHVQAMGTYPAPTSHIGVPNIRTWRKQQKTPKYLKERRDTEQGGS